MSISDASFCLNLSKTLQWKTQELYNFGQT